MPGEDLVLETKVQECAEKCAQYSKEHNEENPDLLIEYGKALFAVAKHSASLVDAQKMEEKQLPRENPNVKVANLDDDEEEGEEEDENGNEQQLNEEGRTEDGEADDEEANGEEEQDDFATAFELVDLARVLYEKRERTPELVKKLVSTRELLGDISLEDDNPTQAVEDYLACIALKAEIYGPDSGEVSEAEFVLSLAYDAMGNIEESLIHLKAAAAAAKAANLPSASELERRQVDLEVEVEAAKLSKGNDKKTASETTKESISGRAAIADAVKSLVSGANDISQITRKRKRGPNTATPAKKNEPDATGQFDFQEDELVDAKEKVAGLSSVKTGPNSVQNGPDAAGKYDYKEDQLDDPVEKIDP